jgi:hypothetical protein
MMSVERLTGAATLPACQLSTAELIEIHRVVPNISTSSLLFN